MGPLTVVVANNGTGVSNAAAPKVSVRDNNTGNWAVGTVTAFGTHGLNGVDTDGIHSGTWVTVSSRGPTAGNGLVGHSTDPNGSVYAVDASGTDVATALTAVACGRKLTPPSWVAGGQSRTVFTSANGKNWIEQLGVLPPSFGIVALVADTVQFIAAGTSGGGTANHASSVDAGVTWASSAYQSNTAYSVLYDDPTTGGTNQILSTVRTLANAPAVANAITGAETLLPVGSGDPLEIAVNFTAGVNRRYCVIERGNIVSAATIAGLTAGTVETVTAGTLTSICCLTGNLFVAVDNAGVAYSGFADGTGWTIEDPGLGAVYLARVRSQ